MALLRFIIVLVAVLPTIVFSLEIKKLLHVHEESRFLINNENSQEWIYTYNKTIPIYISQVEKNKPWYTWHWHYGNLSTNYTWGGGWSVPGFIFTWYNISTPTNNLFSHHIDTSKTPIEFFNRTWRYRQANHSWGYFILSRANYSFMSLYVDSQLHISLNNIVNVKQLEYNTRNYETNISQWRQNVYRKRISDITNNDLPQQQRTYRVRRQADEDWEPTIPPPDAPQERSFFKELAAKIGKLLNKLGEKFHKGFKSGKEAGERIHQNEDKSQEDTGAPKVINKIVAFFGHILGFFSRVPQRNK